MRFYLTIKQDQYQPNVYFLDTKIQDYEDYSTRVLTITPAYRNTYSLIHPTQTLEWQNSPEFVFDAGWVSMYAIRGYLNGMGAFGGFLRNNLEIPTRIRICIKILNSQFTPMIEPGIFPEISLNPNKIVSFNYNFTFQPFTYEGKFYLIVNFYNEIDQQHIDLSFGIGHNVILNQDAYLELEGIEYLIQEKEKFNFGEANASGGIITGIENLNFGEINNLNTMITGIENLNFRETYRLDTGEEITYPFIYKNIFHDKKKRGLL